MDQKDRKKEGEKPQSKRPRPHRDQGKPESKEGKGPQRGRPRRPQKEKEGLEG